MTVRIPVSAKALIEKAASEAGEKRSKFMVLASLSFSRQVLENDAPPETRLPKGVDFGNQRTMISISVNEDLLPPITEAAKRLTDGNVTQFITRASILRALTVLERTLG